MTQEDSVAVTSVDRLVRRVLAKKYPVIADYQSMLAGSHANPSAEYNACREALLKGPTPAFEELYAVATATPIGPLTYKETRRRTLQFERFVIAQKRDAREKQRLLDDVVTRFLI